MDNVSQVRHLKIPIYDSDLTSSYLLVLGLAPGIGSGPLKLFTTDFTRNFNNVEPEFKPLNLEDEQIFRLFVYPERLTVLRAVYHKFTGRHLLSTPNPTQTQDLIDKSCLIKVNYNYKHYNAILEGKVNIFSLITADSPDWTHPYLKQLAFNFLEFRGSPDNLENIIPRKVIDEFEQSKRLKEPLVGVSQQGEQKQPRHPLSREERIKKEILQDDLVPDTRYDDYEDDQSQIPDSLSNSPKITNINNSTNSAPENSLDAGSIGFAESGDMDLHLISQLPLTLDNRIYSLNARIVGTLPQDLSHICVKSYESDGLLTDPHLRPFEIIITDSILEPPRNTLRLYFTQLQVEKMFSKQIELLYTLDEIQTKIRALIGEWKTRRIPFKLFKQRVPLNDDMSVILWTCKQLV